MIYEKKVEAKIFMKDGEPHLRSPGVGEADSLESYMFEGKTTLVDHLEHVCQENMNRKVYQIRKVIKEYIERDPVTGKELITYEYGQNVWLTYGQYLSMVHSCARGLNKFAPEIKKCGFYADTSLDWIMASHSCMMNSIVVSTMYSNMGEKEIIDIVNECELEVILVPAMHVKRMEACKEKCPTLKKLIVIGKKTESTVYETTTLEELMQVGSELKTEFKKPKKEDLAIIMYTSGTTGSPKGVMITHKNATVSICGMQSFLRVTENDVYISYLPLAHIFEQVLHHLFLFNKGTIGFANPRTLMAKPGGAKKIGDLVNIRPTVMVGVPRVWETIKKAVEAKIRAAGGVKEMLFKTVFNRKLGYLRKGNNYTVLLDDTVFKKVRAMFGGRVRSLISGGAALARETNEFLIVAMGVKCSVIQGYGLTETTCATSVQHPFYGYQGVGSVGQLLPCTEVKLIDVPDMGYFAKDLKGEILIRSPTVAQGYFKKPEVTAEVFTKEGWFKTGDVGEMLKDGQIKIIDRVKNLVKLSSGEYVALEQLECIYGNSKFVMPNGICVVADPFESFAVAVVLADVNYLKEWARTSGLGLTNPNHIVKCPEFRKAVAEDFLAIHAKEKRARQDKITKFVIFIDQWGPHNDTTTPSFKLKRRTINKLYAKEIAELYGKVPAEPEKKTDEPVNEQEIVVMEETEGEAPVKKEPKTYPGYFKLVQTY